MALRRREPAVISLPLLAAAVEEEERLAHAPGDAANANYVPTPLAQVASLRLSFRNILRVENLQSLGALVELRLDNNAIARIEGLAHLTRLRWLDLSFNKIKRIEGLSTLGALTDLSLFNNEIAALEGLDGCAELQCLSLGNNALARLEQVLYLRRFKKLEVVALDGNPMCKAAGKAERNGYRAFCLAFLRGLKYLDYAAITAAEVQAAREGGVPAEQLADVEEKDALEARAAARAAERAALIGGLRDAHLEVVETLFDELFEDDGDFAKIRGAPGVAAAVEAFRVAARQSAEDLRELGVDKHRRILEEIAAYEAASGAATGEAEAALAAQFAEWERRFKRAGRGEEGEGGLIETGDDLAAAVRALGDAAISRELRTHDAVESMLDTFEGAMAELRVAKLGAHDVYFRSIEAYENAYHAQVVKLGDQMLADAASGALSAGGELDDELLALAHDRDALHACLAGSHDAHIARILKREGELRVREERRCGGAVASAREAEMRRNRARVVEVRALVDAALQRCAELVDDESPRSSEGG